MVGDLATEDGGDLPGLADGAIGIQEALSQGVQGGAPMEDEIGRNTPPEQKNSRC